MMISLQENEFAAIKDEIEGEIRSLLRVNRDIRDISISYFDGTSIISTDNDEASYILSAAASALKGIADKISSMLKSGIFIKLIIHFENEKIVVFSIDNKINILLRATVNAPLGLLIRDILKLANRVKKLIN